jgi:hypothetical protein
MLTKPTTRAEAAHILSDIRAAKKAIFLANAAGIAKDPCNFYWKLVPRERELLDQAAAAFGKLNGWRRSSGFSLDRLAGLKESGNLEYPVRGIFDHSLFYKQRGSYAAVIGQPYPDKDFSCIDAAQEIADQLGLALHVPQIPTASIHLPGGTAFLLFTSRDHEIRWLPEMLRGVPSYCEVIRLRLRRVA